MYFTFVLSFQNNSFVINNISYMEIKMSYGANMNKIDNNVLPMDGTKNINITSELLIHNAAQRLTSSAIPPPSSPLLYMTPQNDAMKQILESIYNNVIIFYNIAEENTHNNICSLSKLYGCFSDKFINILKNCNTHVVNLNEDYPRIEDNIMKRTKYLYDCAEKLTNKLQLYLNDLNELNQTNKEN